MSNFSILSLKKSSEFFLNFSSNDKWGSTPILFSIFRKLFFKKKPSEADNYHLHHLIYLIVKKYKIVFLKLNYNSVASILILFFNSLQSIFKIILASISMSLPILFINLLYKNTLVIVSSKVVEKTYK